MQGPQTRGSIIYKYTYTYIYHPGTYTQNGFPAKRRAAAARRIRLARYRLDSNSTNRSLSPPLTAFPEPLVCSKVIFAYKLTNIATVRRLPNLHTLDISYAKGLSDDSLRVVAELKHLRSLNVSHNDITSVGIACVAEGCRGLEEIDLGMCERVQDAGVVALAEHCPRLEKLELGSCNLITDAAIFAVSEKCRLLKKLSLFEARYSKIADALYTDASLQTLARCRSLENLCLMFTRNWGSFGLVPFHLVLQQSRDPGGHHRTHSTLAQFMASIHAQMRESRARKYPSADRRSYGFESEQAARTGRGHNDYLIGASGRLQ